MLSKDDAISILMRIFDDHKLSFRDMNLLKQVFDEAISNVDTERSNMLAEYYMGRSGFPSLFPKDIEDQFILSLESNIEDHLSKDGIVASKRAVESITNLLLKDVDTADFYYN